MNGSSSEAQDLMEWFCGSPKTRRVPQEAVLRFRRCVRYTRRPFPVPNFPSVHISLFFAPSAFENASRTPGGCFWHRMRIPYRRRLFLVRVPSKEQGKGPPETRSALTGPKKWRKGPERTKRAESSQKQTAADVIVFFGCLYQESREAAVTRDVKKSSWCALANEMRK